MLGKTAQDVVLRLLDRLPREEVLRLADASGRLSFRDRFRRRLLLWGLHSLPSDALFSFVYRKNIWGGNESRSGAGSSLDETLALRHELPALLAKWSIESMLDVPCGDFYWMKEVNLPLQRYIGADIVQDVVERNNRLYHGAGRLFVRLDLTRDRLPQANLIFCRDCLPHFSYELIRRALTNIRTSGAEFLLTTTFPAHDENTAIMTGWWRPLNLEKAPFCFPPPLAYIHERNPDSRYSDKSLGLWRIQDLP